MKNFEQKGDTVVVTAPEAVSSGEFIMVGGLFGVASVAAENGAEVVLTRQGVFTLPKDIAAAWSQGDRLYWDASGKQFTKSSTGGKKCVGVAFAAALEADTEGKVLLMPGIGGMQTLGGQHTTVTAADTIVTGLSQVVAVVASYDTDPADANTYVSATIGDQAGAPAAGSIIIKTWKQSGSDPTPIAADAFSKKVNWIAVGHA